MLFSEEQYELTRRLHKAAEEDSPAAIKDVLHEGADINARAFDGETALHVAAKHDNIMAINALLEAGANLNAQDNVGFTPLHCAVRLGRNTAVIEALLEAGADINARTEGLADWPGTTPLHEAAMGDNPAAIPLLVAAGAKLDATTAHYFTALDLAAQNNNNPTIITALAAAGANINPHMGILVHSPLQWAAYKNRNPEVITALLECGAEIDARDRMGSTALHSAASNNRNPEVITALLVAGIDINVRNASGLTPLMEAVRVENFAAIAALVKAGADINAQRVAQGGFPLVLDNPIFMNKNPAVIRALLGEEVDLNAGEEIAKTARHKAAKEGRKPIEWVLAIIWISLIITYMASAFFQGL